MGGRATSAHGVNVAEADTNYGSLRIGEKSTPVLQRRDFRDREEQMIKMGKETQLGLLSQEAMREKLLGVLYGVLYGEDLFTMWDVLL